MNISKKPSLPEPIKVFCNGVSPSVCKKRNCKKIELEYRNNGKADRNVTIELNPFIRSVWFIPERIRDLVEICSYVFCADRYFRRGDANSLEYHSWSRNFEYFIKVRDFEFWNDKEIRDNLSEILLWITGDRKYDFNFFPGHETGKSGLFDDEKYRNNKKGKVRVALFSGGLDSLSGAINLLEKYDEPVWMVSHRSGNPSTERTQKKLIDALNQKYLNRINYTVFKCHLHKSRAPEETQRTRAILYLSIAFATAFSLNQNSLYVFENGLTGINFYKRGAMINARASRTAHPKTIRMMESLLSKISGNKFTIESPFAFKTKTDIIELIKDFDKLDLINSSVSCSRTYQKLGNATHCGKCSQCIDRRFAVYAAEADSKDEGGIYSFDFLNEKIDNGELRTQIIDYLRQAQDFYDSNIDYL